MRIALIESRLSWENKKKNLDKLRDALEELSTKKIDLVLLPEMSFTGFSMNVGLTKESNLESIRQVKELSCRYNVAIGFGWVKATDEKCENHYSIVKADEVIADYIKIHPFSYSKENDFFIGGDKISICQIDDFKIGTQICYDLRFPEVFQIISKKADFIVVPANWPQKRRDHWNTLLKARAIENQVYIAGINCKGYIGGLDYSGDTKLIKPNGTSCEPEEILSTNMDTTYVYEIKNDVNDYRDSFPLKKDRKEELYEKLRIEEVKKECNH